MDVTQPMHVLQVIIDLFPDWFFTGRWIMSGPGHFSSTSFPREIKYNDLGPCDLRYADGIAESNYSNGIYCITRNVKVWMN